VTTELRWCVPRNERRTSGRSWQTSRAVLDFPSATDVDRRAAASSGARREGRREDGAEEAGGEAEERLHFFPTPSFMASAEEG